MTEKAKQRVCVIGAAIMDIIGFPEKGLKEYDSVPGKIKMTPGGVGRNIAENLALLSMPVSLITVLGDDPFSKMMIDQAKSLGLDISKSLFLKNRSSALHLVGMDRHNDMAFGIADLDPFSALSPENLEHLLPFIDASSFCILETNIPKNTIHWILDKCKNTKFILDPVSAPLSIKLKGVLDKIDIFCPNIKEAESIIGQPLNSEELIKKAGEWFISKGLQEIFITLGQAGVYFRNSQESGWIQAPSIKVVNTIGAGDAFLAGLVYGLWENLPIADRAYMGIASAGISLSYTSSVNPNSNKKLLTRKYQALKAEKKDR